MSIAPAMPFLKRGVKRVRPRAPEVRAAATTQPIEIVSPDRYCTAVLLQYAAPMFPAEIVAGSGWIVRLQTPAGGAWVVDFLAVVERWLGYVGLPCAKAVYGGRSYLIRASP
jgi:hypothetical protein